MTTFRNALLSAGWAYPEIDEYCGAAVQRIVRGKQVGPTIYWPKISVALDVLTGYDYAKKEEWRVFAWDENFVYLQINAEGETDFIPIPREQHYAGEPIVVINCENCPYQKGE